MSSVICLLIGNDFWTFSLIFHIVYLFFMIHVMYSEAQTDQVESFHLFGELDRHVKKIPRFQLTLTVTYLCCLTYFVGEQSRQFGGGKGCENDGCLWPKE